MSNPHGTPLDPSSSAGGWSTVSRQSPSQSPRSNYQSQSQWNRSATNSQQPSNYYQTNQPYQQQQQQHQQQPSYQPYHHHTHTQHTHPYQYSSQQQRFSPSSSPGSGNGWSQQQTNSYQQQQQQQRPHQQRQQQYSQQPYPSYSQSNRYSSGTTPNGGAHGGSNNVVVSSTPRPPLSTLPLSSALNAMHQKDWWAEHAAAGLATEEGTGASTTAVSSTGKSALIEKNITSFSSLNPLLPLYPSPTDMRGAVFRSPVQGDGTCAIMEVSGMALPTPQIIWGDMECVRPQKRYDDNDTLVDFVNGAPSDMNDFEYLIQPSLGGRMFTIFTYSVDGVVYPCLETLHNAPYWKAQLDRDGQPTGHLATDRCTRALLAYMAREKLIPNSATKASGSVTTAAPSSSTLPAGSVQLERPPSYVAPTAPWSTSLSRANSQSAAVSSTPSGTSSVQLAFQRLFAPSTPFQSLTFEWFDPATDEECLVGVPSSSSSSSSSHVGGVLRPIFFQTHQGEIELFIDFNSQTPSSYLTGTFQRTNQQDLQQLIRTILNDDEHANREWRRQCHFDEGELETGYFATLGRNMFILPRGAMEAAKAAATTEATPSTSGATHVGALRVLGRKYFALVPRDLESASSQVMFSPAVESSIRRVLTAMVASHGCGSSAFLRQPRWSNWIMPDMLQRLSRGGDDRILPRRLQQVKAAIESYARTVAEGQYEATMQAQTSTTAAAAKKTKSNNANDQRIIILVAFAGAGKSHFCHALMRHAATSGAPPSVEDDATSSVERVPPSADASVADASLAVDPPRPRVWIRVNQDTLGSRKACESVADRGLRDGHSLIIDRTNIDISQRSTWLKLGRKYGVRHIECVHLKIPVEICKQRVLDRVGHETLPSNRASLAIVERFLANFVPPIMEEGFTRIHTFEYTSDKKEEERRFEELIKACDTNNNREEEENNNVDTRND